MTNDRFSMLRRYFHSHLAQTSECPPGIGIQSGNGCFLYDGDGKEYLDFMSGISVSSLGHNNPEIQQAVLRQIQNHAHVMVYGEYVIGSQVILTRKLAELLPPDLSVVYLTNSGTEAVEGAMKLAKRYTGKPKFIACRNAYHGSTQGALSLMGNEYFKQAFRPLLPEVYFIEFNNPDDAGMIDDHTAAVIVDPFLSENGYCPATKEFLSALRERCNETGALLIFDEAQCGMGRTGKMFGFEHACIIPDILVLAKALGGGYPLGAFISSGTIMNVLSHDPPLGHLTTFGGHPVSCAAAIASLELLKKDGFIDSVSRKEALFRNSLSETFRPEQITGKGLMLAVHLEDEQICHKLVDHCMNDGLLTDWFLFAPNALRIAPPLIISDELIEKGCRIIRKAL